MTKNSSLYTDVELVEGLVNLDPGITSYVFYQRCYPLFKHLFYSYYTDCKTCLDLAHEIYILIMLPGPQSGKSKLQTFEFRSTFDTWLSVVSHHYCFTKYKKRVVFEYESSDKDSDRKRDETQSIAIDMSSISRSDIETVIGLMPNKRYQAIIRLIYLEGKDNDETALELGMSKSNLYNKHILARIQFERVMKREGLL